MFAGLVEEITTFGVVSLVRTDIGVVSVRIGGGSIFDYSSCESRSGIFTSYWSC